MSPQAAKPTSTIRGILGLSVGTMLGRVLSTAGQFLLAFWLSPTEFGYWAAAISAISLLSGLANFGEVNAYLSGQGTTFRRVQKSTRFLNLGLAVVGVGVAGIYYFNGRHEVAALGLLAAITIPFAGRADLAYAVGVKYKAYKRAASSQVIGAIVKIAVGVAIAVLSGSAWAIAVSTLVFYLVAEICLWAYTRRVTAHESDPAQNPSLRSRLSWAANTISMTLPLYVGFLAAQFVASPEFLGLFYLAFQATVGITGLIAVPLSRVSLSTLGALIGRDRILTALRLSSVFGAGMLVVAAVLAGTLPLVEDLIPREWQNALPAVIIMFASMPARMMGPVADAFQQASGRWWQSTAFNLADAVGTAAVALLAVTGDLILVVTALSVWKISLALVRAVTIFRSAGWSRNVGNALPAALGGLCICAVPWLPDLRGLLVLAALVVAGAWLLLSKVGARRSRARHRLEKGSDPAQAEVVR